jgi:hypothetical protein
MSGRSASKKSFCRRIGSLCHEPSRFNYQLIWTAMILSPPLQTPEFRRGIDLAKGQEEISLNRRERFPKKFSRHLGRRSA